MGHYWDELWPQVLAISFLIGVIGNLIASLLWAVPAFARLHAKLDRHHAERLAQADRHHQAVMTALSGPGSKVAP